MSIISRLLAGKAAKDATAPSPIAQGATAPDTALRAAEAAEPPAVQPASHLAPKSPTMSQNTPAQQHTVASFDADLNVLGNMIAEMGARSGRALADATRALVERNMQLAQQVIAADRGLDVLQHEIEERAVATLALRQPVAVDLREIVSAMRIAGDLERVGDLAKNLAKRVIAIGEQPSPVNLASGLSTLSERVGQQLTAVLRAYADRDDAAALEVWRADGAIDGLFTSLFRELLTYMMEDPRSIGFCTHLLFCAKNLERAGDHATNIAETAHYVVTGEVLIAERPKGDESSALDASLRPTQT